MDSVRVETEETDKDNVRDRDADTVSEECVTPEGEVDIDRRFVRLPNDSVSENVRLLL